MAEQKTPLPDAAPRITVSSVWWERVHLYLDVRIEAAGLREGDFAVQARGETLVIADRDRPLAIAGIMGGIDSGVQVSTTDLFLECACFAPEVIAGKARQYAMHTDSSHRFERGVDPFLQQRAMQRATGLLLDIVGGHAGPVIEVAAQEHLPAREPVRLRRARIERVLGMLPEPAEVADILERLGMS